MFKKLVILLALIFIAPFKTMATPDEAKFRLGVAVPLSGPMAWLGENTRKGIEVYLDNNPEFREKTIIIYEDVGTAQTASGVLAVRRLIDTQKIDGLIIENSAVTNAAAPIIDQAKVPTIAIVGDDSATGRKFLLKLWLLASVEAAEEAAYMAKQDLKKIALVTSEQDSMLARSRAFKATEQGKQLVFDETIASQDDINSIVPRILQAKPDAVLMNVMPGSCGPLARKLREQSFKGKFVGPLTCQDPSEIALAQGGLQGAAVPVCLTEEKFSSLYQKKYGTPPPSISPNGFDAVAIFDTAIKSVKTPRSPEELLTAMKLKDFSGALGKYSFSFAENNAFNIPVKLIIVGQ